MSINPLILKKNREYLNLSLEKAASLLKFKKERVEQWEKGEVEPNYHQLLKIGKVYCIDPSKFYLKQWEAQGFKTDFRIRGKIFNEFENYPLRKLLIKAKERIQIYEIYNTKKQKRYTNTNELINEIRNKIPYAEQRKAKDIFAFLLEKLENLFPVLVFQTNQWNKISENINGITLSLSQSKTKAIIINREQSTHSRAFTLLHELCHLFLQEEHSFFLSLEKNIEKKCNAFASEILLPEEALQQEIKTIHNWDEKTIQEISRKLNISRTHLLTRLRMKDIIQEDFYRKQKAIYDQKYKKQKQGDGGFVKYIYKVRNTLGRNYIKTILDAYGNNQISYYTALRDLEINVKHFEDLMWIV